MDQDRTRRAPQRNNSRSGISGTAAVTLLSSVVLGLSLIISSLIVSGAVRKLTGAVENQTFASSYSSPSTVNIKTPNEKKYMSVKEAADYLGLTEDDIKKAIKDKKITEYVKTKNGYSIATDKLDAYFEEIAYEQYKSDNSKDE